MPLKMIVPKAIVSTTIMSLLGSLSLSACTASYTPNKPSAQSLNPTPSPSASSIAKSPTPSTNQPTQKPIATSATSKGNSKGKSMSSPTSSNQASSSNAAAVTLSQADSGKTVTLQQGQTLILQLDENPTTGYRWELPSLPATELQLMRDQFTSSNSGAMGAGGQRTLTFQAGNPGQVNLVLHNRRAWESVGQGVAQFNLTLKIVAK
ncbi:MAG: protease inhibitor I42 family protein [Synechococcales bacterium]|nr:protease inhibitor I42 family protein [Synechococcales bacterium]